MIGSRGPGSWRAFAGLWVTTMLGLVAVGAVFPVMPRYVTRELGSTDLAVGIVIGAFAVTALLARPVGGRLADLRGRRVVVVGGALLASVGGFLYLVPAGIPGLVLARLFVGAGEGMVFVAGSAWVMDVAPAHRRARSIGLYGLAVWSGLALGPLLGEAVLRVGSFTAVWLTTAALPLIGAAIAARIPEAPRPTLAATSPDRRGIRAFLAREAVGPGSALACAVVGFAAISSFIVLHLEARGVGGGAVAFTAFAASVVLTRLVAGDLPDRIGPLPAALGAAGVEVGGLVTIALAESLPVAIAGCALTGAAFSTIFPALSVMVVNRVSPERRGAALGTFTAFFDLGVGIGAPLVGGVAAIWGYPAVFVAAAAAAGVALAVLAVQQRRAGREPRTAGTGDVRPYHPRVEERP